MMKRPTCLDCYRLTRMARSPATCARCIALGKKRPTVRKAKPKHCRGGNSYGVPCKNSPVQNGLCHMHAVLEGRSKR